MSCILYSGDISQLRQVLLLLYISTLLPTGRSLAFRKAADMSASPIDLLTNADTQDDDHELRGNELPAVCYVLLVLVFASVSLRVYIRAYVQRWFGYDDVLIIVSFVSQLYPGKGLLEKADILT